MTKRSVPRRVTTATVASNPGGYPITAFCDDGTVWRQSVGDYGDRHLWVQIASIPFALVEVEEVQP